MSSKAVRADAETAHVPATASASASVAGSCHFTLYSRSYCHLCQDMIDALQSLPGMNCSIDVIDVDADPVLLAKYDELVPVLFGDLAEPELCHYFLDESSVRQYLAQHSR
jgi:hypothetical protein